MPLDLSHPRHLVPAGTTELRRAVHLKLTEDVLRQLLDVVAPPTKQGGEHKIAGGQIMVNVDGPHPVLVVGGISHPLSVVPEAADTSLVRLSPASRDLVPVATVSHRATVQHRPADLDKAGQRARENREQVERAKEARKAVLLDEPPRIGNGSNSSSSSSSKKRSASNPRPRQLGAAAAASASASTSSTPHPLSAPSSRLASPAIPASPSLASSAGQTSTSTVRHPSRLTAVPQTATAAPTVSAPAPSAAAAASRPPVGPSGTFRIGKGAVTASLSRSGSASSSTSSSSSSGGSAIPLAAATASLSNAQAAAADGGKSTGSAGVQMAPNGTEEVAKATNAALPSANKMEIDPPESPPEPAEAVSPSSSSKRATATARSSPPPFETAADKSPASSKGEHKAIRPGGGGLMKGKESLKKEKRREERQRDHRPNAAAAGAAAAAASGPAPPTAAAGAKSTTSVGVPKGVNPNKIKSEAFVNDSDDEMSDVDADGEADADGQVDDGVGSEVPATVAAATKPKEPKSSPLKVDKDSPPERKKRRLEEPAPKPVRKASVSSKTAASSPKMNDKPLKRSTVVESAAAPVSKDSGSEATVTAGARPKKRKKEVVKRWYSSSSEEDDAETTDRDRTVKGKNGSTLDGARVEAPAKTASPEKTSMAELAAGPRAASRMSYLEAYAAYAELYARLAAERAALEEGTAGPLLAAAAGDAPRRVQSMIDELSEKRRALEALHSGSTREASS